MSEYLGTATYSPEDNKIRFYPDCRLAKEDYDRIKAAGFRWAPKQELFVAPMWTPGREDLMLEWCGEIGDEDTSLVDRAEERAERFETYSEKRERDAEAAKRQSDRIAEGIPLGQPILVGHHSERRARKDAERIRRGFDKAVTMWRRSAYWEARAAGALRHAKYKELPAVRARRIKTLESELRKCKAAYTPDPKTPAIMQTPWRNGKSADEKTPHVWCGQGRGGSWVEASKIEGIKAAMVRWEEHYENRIAYERAMLGEQTGHDGSTDRWPVEVGGRLLYGNEWLVVLRVNKGAEGRIVSVTTQAPARHTWAKQIRPSIEKCTDYRPPTDEDKQAAKKATAKPPLCNYPGPGFHEMTKAEWKSRHADFKTTRFVEASEASGEHRIRYTYYGGKYSPVYLTDDKRKDPPGGKAPAEPPKVTRYRERAAVEAPRLFASLPEPRPRPTPNDSADAKLDKADQLAEMLKAKAPEPVMVSRGTECFPTPPAIVAQMIERANIEPGQRILEPSAGTGAILRGLRGKLGTMATVVAVEKDGTLWSNLRDSWGFNDLERLKQADFLSINGELGEFDRVLMNPPFRNLADVDHVRNAWAKLKPGGLLVAIMGEGAFFRSDRKAQGFREWLDNCGGESEKLPPDAFKASGTSVNTRLVVIPRD